MSSNFRALVLVIVFYLVTPGAVDAQQGWRAILVDGFGTTWWINLASLRNTSEGTEVWVKKVFDPDKACEIFNEYQIKPSAYDLELWLLHPQRQATMLQVVRYDLKGRTIAAYDFQARGQPPKQVIPPDSSMEAIWKLVGPDRKRE